MTLTKTQQYYKNYYQNNKETIKKKNDNRSKEKITCDCQGCFQKISKAQHLRSKLHRDFLIFQQID